MGTPVVMGREFTARDTTSSSRVAIVNRAFARRYLPAGSELGQRLRVGSRQAVEFEIVGVVTDSIYETLREAAPPTVYCPVSQRAGGLSAAFGVIFEAHAGGSLAQAAESLRATLQPALPGSPVEVHALNRASGARAGEGAADGDTRGEFRNPRPGAGSRRLVWTVGLYRSATHQRNRHPNGARSYASGSVVDGDQGCTYVSRHGGRRRHSCSMGRIALRVVPALRGDRNGSR